LTIVARHYPLCSRLSSGVPTLAESRGALVPGTHPEADSARQLYTVDELIDAIEQYRQQTNRQRKPLVWTASVEKILEKINRCKVILETVHQRHGLPNGKRLTWG
jgi:hypothetical protein